MENVKEPKTLLDAVAYFSSPDNCRNYLVPRRWPKGIVTCPHCGTDKVKFQPKHNRWQCSVHHPKRQFTLKTGTIMEDSPIGLDKWLPAIWLLSSNRNGISSWELHRALGVTQKTAWFLLQRIRLAMQDENIGGKLGGTVEVDETFIGGKARNMHKNVKARKLEGKGGGTVGKIGVQGFLERGGKVKATVIENTRFETLVPHVHENVEKGSHVMTDEFRAYFGLQAEYVHSVINHAEEYVNGQIHTNGIENFWALLKRGLSGTYVSVEPFHLFRYVDEQAFRYNNRLPMSDTDRFGCLVRKIVGKRLTYAELIGKEDERPEPF